MPAPTSSFLAPSNICILATLTAGVSLFLFTFFLPRTQKYLLRLSTLRALHHAEFVKVGTVAALNIYPIKSAKGIPLTSLHCGELGVTPSASSLLLDRGWLVVFGDTYRFVTIRQEPTLVLVKVSFDEETKCMTLSAPDADSVTFTIPTSGGHDVRRTKVFGTASSGVDCGDEVADWLSSYLKRPGHRLFYKAPLVTEKMRDLSETLPWSDIDAKCDLKYRNIAYQDEAPVLVTNLASLQSLNTKLETTLVMGRFRPNIVVEGPEAWEEDRWEHVLFCREGMNPNRDQENRKVVLRRVAPSTRCKVPTVDPSTGVMDPEEEPLRTLKTFHPWGVAVEAETDASFRTKAVFGNCMGIVVEGRVEARDEVWAVLGPWTNKA